MIVLKTVAEIEKIRRGGKIIAEVLKGIGEIIRPGLTTQELDRWAERFILDRRAVPAFKGYRGFPAVLCTSVNEEVVHGIPGKRILKNGDILSVDVGVKFDDWYSDAAWTFSVGEVSEQAQRLMRITRESLDAGVAAIGPDRRLSDIGHAVQRHVEAAGFSVVRDFVGHGVGRELHEDPQVPNFGEPGQGPRLKDGMVLAIEPMVNAGEFEVEIQENQWTVVTKDGSLSAHFEHTVAILGGQAEVLTR